MQLKIQSSVTRYQQHAIGFKDLGIQLWEVHKYNNDLLVFNEVKSPSTKEPITTIVKNNAVAKKVTEEIKAYTGEVSIFIVRRHISSLVLFS